MFKKKIKKFLIYTFLSLFISSFLISIYVFFPKLLNSFDNRIRDAFFIYRDELPTNNNIVIVDIDEPAMESFGQWPWSRNILSKIIENLNSSNVAVIGMDIIFAEEDRTSPALLAKKFNIKDRNFEDYDLEFSNIISSSPVVLGYTFDLLNENSKKDAPQIPAIFIEKHKDVNSQFLLDAKGAITNYSLIQNSAYTSGFLNAVPDFDGVIRSSPLLISYEDTLYSSLALEMIRVLNDTKKVIVNYDENGVSNIVLDDIVIPTDRYGRLLINYRGAEKTFEYISAKDIYNNSFKKEQIDGKIVLFGTSAAGLYDLRAIPFDNIYPGVEVHANIIDNILQGDFIVKSSYLDGVNIVLIALFSFLVVMIVTSLSFYLKPLVFLVFFPLSAFASYKILFDYGLVLNIVFPLLAITFSFVSSVVLDFFYNIKQQNKIKEKFASKVSKEVMDDILKHISDDKFSAGSKEITIFFSDIRAFTQISEKLSPKELIEFLNRYMEPMSKVIVKHHGTIDKFIGDAIMAYWNAPLDTKDHADVALKASLEQLEILKELNKELEEENLPRIDIGIGLNTGEAIVGEMGSSLRSDYTVIGDTINLGSRVESLCKYYGSKLNITNFTKQKLKDDYIFRFLDLVKVKGKDEAIEIWEVLGAGFAKNSLKEELELYEKAIQFYKNSKFKEALEIFINLENNIFKTNESIYKIYINRCEKFIKTPPKNFNGVFEHITKA